MFLQKLESVKQKTYTQNEFRGVDYNIYADKYGFSDMENISAESYPVLSTRKKRGFITKLTKPNGIFAKNGLSYVDGERLYHNGNFCGYVEDSKKTFVSMGANLIIFPDKISLNTATGEISNLEAQFTAQTGITATLSDHSGKAYENVTVSASAPENAQDGDFWLDTSSIPHKLKVYSLFEESFFDIETTYVKIAANGIGALFSKYEGVKIQGIIKEQLNGDFVISEACDNFIVIAAVLDEVFSQETEVTVTRSVPPLDFVTQCGNRLWGCSNKNREIYASRFGDAKSWYSFSGLSTDSYAVAVGSNGDFTGCAAIDSCVIFFKEDTIHKVYGTKPANFTLTEILSPGVEKGSEKSIAQILGNLYYKSRDSFCVFDGSCPYSVSKAVNPLNLKNAVSGSFKDYYYACAESTSGKSLFVFNENTSLWYREDNIDITDFAYERGELYALKSNGELISIFGRLSLYEGAEPFSEQSGIEDDFNWYAVTPDLNYSSPEFAYLCKIMIKAELSKGASLNVFVSYNSDEFEKALSITAENEQAVSIPLILKRSKSIKLKLCGKGDVKIKTLTKYLESGGEI